MNALWWVLIYRLFSVRTLIFFFALIGLNVTVFIIFTQHTHASVNRLLFADMFAFEYFMESLFFVKVSLMITLMVVSEKLFNQPSMDMALIKRATRTRLCVSKWFVSTAVSLGVGGGLFIMMVIIYSFTPYVHAYAVPWYTYAILSVMLMHYSVLYGLVYQWFSHTYAAISIFLFFMISEILGDVHITAHNLSFTRALYYSLFPTIHARNHTTFAFSGDWGMWVSVFTVFVTLSVVRAQRQNY